MKPKSRYRIFLGRMDICGWYSGMCITLREMGHEAEFLSLGNLAYSDWDMADSYWLTRRFRLAFLAMSEPNPGLLARLTFVFWQRVYIIWLGLWADIIVLKSGENFSTTGWDVRFWRRLGVVVIIQCHGTDSRPPYLAGNVTRTNAQELRARIAETRERMDAIDSSDALLIDNPLGGQFHTRAFFNGSILGNVVSSKKAAYIRSVPGQIAGATTRILHCPSNPTLKGSDLVRAVVGRLKAEGYDIDYVEIKERPNQEVMQALAEADVVVDEMYSDMFGAVFALESMHAGRATIVCGYGLDELERLQSIGTRMPTHFGRPEQLYDLLKALIEDADLRSSKEAEAREYTDSFGSARATAERLLRIAVGAAPDDWLVDPFSLTYFKGCVASEAQIHDNLNYVLQHLGSAGLMIDDKPALRDAMVAFANGPRPC